MERSDEINVAENIVALLRRFEHAVEVLRAAQNIQATMGDLQRDRQAEQGKLEEAKAAVKDTQAILARAKEAVGREQVRLEQALSAAQRAEDALAKHRAALSEAIDRQALDLEAGLKARGDELEATHLERVATLHEEVLALEERRDTLRTEVDAILTRLGGR